jgi:hypothetical protein
MRSQTDAEISILFKKTAQTTYGLTPEDDELYIWQIKKLALYTN